MSVALEVCRIAEAHVGREGLARVVEVGLEVGDDAGVELGSLEFCLEALLTHPPFAGARPALMRVGGDALRVTYLEVEDGDPHD